MGAVTERHPRKKDPLSYGASECEEEGRRLGDRQDDLLGAGHRHGVPVDPLPALLDPVRLDEADAAGGRVSLRLEILLWLFALFLPLCARSLLWALLGKHARARRCHRLPSPGRWRLLGRPGRVRRATRPRAVVDALGDLPHAPLD